MTSQALYGQLIQSGSMIGAGAAVVLLLDILHEISCQIKWNRYQYMLAEFMVMLFCGIGFCIYLIAVYQGQLRIYSLWALLLGAGVYYRIVHPYSSYVCRALAKIIIWVSRRTAAVFLFPWKLIYRQIFLRAKKHLIKIRQRRKDALMTELQEHDRMEKII